ncbi:hypothetical protein BDV12DRAFT_205583 [Aspergillus spectabilis]
MQPQADGHFPLLYTSNMSDFSVPTTFLSTFSSLSSRSSHSPRSSSSLPDKTGDSHTTSQSTFLFIDSQADRAQNAALRTQKKAFLLKNYYRKKKHASIERLKYLKAAPTDGRRIGYTAGDHSTTAEDERMDQTENPKIPSSRQTTLESEMWSLKGYLSQGFVDPFSSSAVKMTDSMNLYFHHFRTHTVSTCYPLDATRMGMWWWQRAITQPALLQAILFLTANHLAALESNSGISSQTVQKSIRDSLHLRGETLRILHDIMQDPAKSMAKSTPLIVAIFVAAEAVSANFEALEVHMKGLQRLIHLVGGLDTLDYMTLVKIYECDVRSAALNNTQPVFPMSTRWRSEIIQASKFFHSREPLKMHQNLSLLGVSFFNAPWYPQLDPAMKTIIHVLRRLILHYEEVQLHPSTVMPTDNDLFLVFEHQLLSMSYPSRTDDVHEPLRLSLLVYLNLRIWHFQTLPFMQYMVEALKQSLETPFSHLQATAQGLLFWVLFFGSLASNGYDCHPWFINNLITMTRQLGLEDRAIGRAVLRGFFYTDQAGEKAAEENLWNKVLLKTAFATYMRLTHHIPSVFVPLHHQQRSNLTGFLSIEVQ